MVQGFFLGICRVDVVPQIADEQRRADVAAERQRWRDWQPLRDLRRCVFLDECGVTTDLIRRYGRSLRGTRLRDHAPCGHWQTHSVVAALRLDGLGTPAVFDGPIDKPTFFAYVEQVLVPTLRPGDVVVLQDRSQTVDSKVERCRSGRSSTLGNCSGRLRYCATDFDYRCEAKPLTSIASPPSITVNLGKLARSIGSCHSYVAVCVPR
jgi:hypothetical protein